MALNFKDGFNKFAEVNNGINRKLNKAIGKDVFGEVKKIEDEREFPEYESYPEYSVPEPEQWPALKGEEKSFYIQGYEIKVTAALDTCILYRDNFYQCARYYADRFEYKYKMCATDFDAFLHYFEKMYLEGLTPMAYRAYSLFLPLGIFDSDVEAFSTYHTGRFNKAIQSYQTMMGIENAKNAQAAQLGNTVGNSVTMRGGGFGFKGAMKGMAQAEAFNLGMSVMGKFVEHQNRMTPEQKAEAWEKFRGDILIEEVYSDYLNTYYTLLQFLADRGLIGEVSTLINKDDETIYNNLKNPMFPKEQFVPTVVKQICKNPFQEDYYKMLILKMGDSDEVSAVRNYFMGNVLDK